MRWNKALAAIADPSHTILVPYGAPIVTPFGLRVIQENPESVLPGFGETMLVLRLEGTPGTISHLMFGIDGYDADELRAELTGAGLEPQAPVSTEPTRSRLPCLGDLGPRVY